MTETWNNGRHESLRGDSERGERRSTSHQKSGLLGPVLREKASQFCEKKNGQL